MFCSPKPRPSVVSRHRYVYRGKRYAKEYGGSYIFADYETYQIARIAPSPTTKGWESFPLADGTVGIGQISTFAEDHDGELWFVNYNPQGIYRLPCPDCAAGGIGPDPDDSVTLSAVVSSGGGGGSRLL